MVFLTVHFLLFFRLCLSEGICAVPQEEIHFEKLFGPPTGGTLRFLEGRHKCWAKRENDHELLGTSLRELGAPSEWTPGSEPDQIMQNKSWDVAYRWRSLNLSPFFSFLRACMPQEVLNSMGGLDYLTHRANPSVNPVSLDYRYEQHLFDDEFEYPCMPHLQYLGDGENTSSSAEKCLAAGSCGECVALGGCGWCSSGTNGTCVPLGQDKNCSRWDVHQCIAPVIGIFDCGTCTGGTEYVLTLSSKMNQVGIPSSFMTTCSHPYSCEYDMPFFKGQGYPSASDAIRMIPDGSTLWTCLGCTFSQPINSLLETLKYKKLRKYQLVLGYHKGLQPYSKVKRADFRRVGSIHSNYDQMLDTGVKKLSSGLGKYWYDTELSLEKLAKLKRNLVATDNDFKMDWECVRSNAKGPDGVIIPFELVRLEKNE